MRPDPKRGAAMSTSPTLPVFSAIIVAAGKGLRVGGDMPKQLRQWRGKPVLQRCVDALNDAGCDRIVLVAPAGLHDEVFVAAGKPDNAAIVDGGATRQDSVRAGLEALAKSSPRHVLIHDAARPDLPLEVIERLVAALANHAGAIPTLPVVDSLVVAGDAQTMAGTAERETLRRVQTPQAFRFDAILAAHRNWTGASDAGDDAQVLVASSGSVALVDGDERLKKITFAEDFTDDMTMPAFRIGQGFDVHRLQKGEELWLCGVQIDHDKGLAGHSDADVALHAITDAVLGAIGDGDIGTHFPPSDPQWAGVRSGQFLEHATHLARDAGYQIGNIDLTIICEAPKIGPHRQKMRERLAQLTGVHLDAVSVKATTTERLGFAGREEGIAAQAIVGLCARK